MTENKLLKKDNKKILIILAVFIIVLTAGYIFKDKIFAPEDSSFSDQVKNDQQEVDDITTEAVSTTVQGAGKIEPIEGMKIENLQIVSLGNVSDVDEDGKFTTTLYQDKATPIAAMLPNQDFGLVNIILSDDDNKNDGLELTAETTAVSLIFMTPFLVTSNPDEASKILEVIKNDENVKKFALVINKKIGIAENIMQDDEYKIAFKEALESVLLKLSQ